MSKRTIIKGTLILTITGILTKCLGFYNRIFLTRLIGVKELGTYQLIFPLYILGISFCCQGIATTVTKHVSYLLGKQKQAETRRLYNTRKALYHRVADIAVRSPRLSEVLEKVVKSV